MNPIILKIISSPINCQGGNNGSLLKSVKGTGDFFASIQKLLNSAQKKPFHHPTRPAQTGPALKKGYKFYIESLRKGLLVRGKPLNKISLNKKDLFVLKKFLYHCGFSQESVEKFLQGLAENKLSGEINLSEFFHKLTELEPPEKKSYQPVALDISVIPHLESLLRDFGLSPKELDHVFSYAKLEGGKLDLKRLVIKLKEISNQINPRDPERNQVTIDRDVVCKVLKKLEGIGIQIPTKKMDGRVSIKDLITALEQMAGGPGKGGLLPADVKASIDQIVEKVAVSAEKESLVSSLLSFSRPELTALHSDSRPGLTALHSDSRPELTALHSDSRPELTALHSNKKTGKNKAAEKENIPSLLKKNGANARPSHLSENEISSITRTRDTGLTLKMGGKEEGHIIKSETGKMDVPCNIGSSTSSDIINNVKQQPGSARNLLPAYLINQVGKQISRSILRGERVIRLQLKPPDLGTVKIEMNIKGNILKLGMIAENSSVKELLLSNVHELKQVLVEQGVKLDKLDVQINYNFGQSLSDSKESTKQNQRWNKGMNSIPFIEENESQIMQRIVSRGDCLLDLIV